MPQVTIRRLTDSEDHLNYLFPLTNYGFRASPPMPTEEEMRGWLQPGTERIIFVIFEDDQVVAGAGCIPMYQNVRGGIYPMGGIAPVVTLPQARRKGYARRLMQQHFEDMYEMGQVFSGLYPFRESFYERLGYVTFPQVRTVKFSPQNLLPLLKSSFNGSVEMLPIKDGFDQYRIYTELHLPYVHGMAYFPPVVATRTRDSHRWLALAKSDGNIIGCMLYHITGYFETLKAEKFLYNAGAGRFLLLEWLARHADQVREIEIKLPAHELPETWFSDMTIKSASHDWVTPMGRVINVGQMGGMLVGSGHFNARIVDELAPWNNSIFNFQSSGGQLRVIATRTLADFTLTIQGLSALAYGTHDPGDFAYRGWGDPNPDQQMLLRGMFPRRLPYMHEDY